MKLEYNQKKAVFAELAKEISQELNADAVMLIVFGSPEGSGCCCDIRPLPAEAQYRLGHELVRNLRAIADALEKDLNTNTFPPDDPDQHEQTFE